MKGRNYPAIIGWILGTLFALLLAAAMAHATPFPRRMGSAVVPQGGRGFAPNSAPPWRRGGFLQIVPRGTI